VSEHKHVGSPMTCPGCRPSYAELAQPLPPTDREQRLEGLLRGLIDHCDMFGVWRDEDGQAYKSELVAALSPEGQGAGRGGPL